MYKNNLCWLNKKHSAEFCDLPLVILPKSQTFDKIKTTPAAISNQIGKVVMIYGFSFKIEIAKEIVGRLKKEIVRC